MERKFYQNKRNYILCLIFLILAFLVTWFVRVVSSEQVIMEYSDEFVALAELPSQLSFTYFGEEEWEEKLKDLFHKKRLDGKLTYGKLEALLEQLSVGEYMTYENGFFWKAVPRAQWDGIYGQILDLLDASEKVSAVNLVFLAEDGADTTQGRLTQEGYYPVADGVNYFGHYDMFRVYV